MDFKNCKDCGKVFQSNGFSRICQRCQMGDEENYRKVKEYIYDHPGADINEVSVKTSVPVDKVLRYLREGRLEIIGGGSLILDCERCNKSISTGRFCDSCAREIERELKKGFNHPEKGNSEDKPKQRMFIAEMRKKNN